MCKVDIYIKASNRTIRRCNRTIMYLMAYLTSVGTTVTYPSVDRLRESIIETAGSWTESEAEILARALGCLNRPCNITVHTECAQLKTVLDRWIPGWKAKGWIKTDGTQVQEVYRSLEEAMQTHKITVTQEHHEYDSWMETQLKGEKK